MATHRGVGMVADGWRGRATACLAVAADESTGSPLAPRSAASCSVSGGLERRCRRIQTTNYNFALAMMEDESLTSEAVTHFLVREYLARTSRQALTTLDLARPQTASDASNKADVIKHLRLDRALRTNRGRMKPLSTLLEVLVAEHTVIVEANDDDDDDDDSDDSDEGLPRLRPPKNTMPPLATPTMVTLPSGGPLEAHLRAKAARSARPASARPGSARTPSHVSVTELPATAAAYGNRQVGPASSSSSSSVPSRPKHATFIGERDRQLVVPPGDVCGGTVELLELEGCEVLILDWSSQVIIEECRRCKVLLGPVDGSVMARACTGVQIHAACRQLRTRDCTDCALHLFTLGPILESSHGITISPWSVTYPQLSAHFGAAKLDPTAANKWREVHDFNDPDKTADPPNWHAAPALAWTVATVPGDTDGMRFGKADNLPVVVGGMDADAEIADVSEGGHAEPSVANAPPKPPPPPPAPAGADPPSTPTVNLDALLSLS